MPRRGKRKRLARGVFEDQTGRAGIIHVHGKPVELRCPPFTPIAKIRDRMAAELKRRHGSGRARASRGTLAAAVDAWDDQETHLASWKERRAELRAWVKLYGNQQLNAIDADAVRRAIGIWTAAGVAPKTIRNRLWSLKHLYRLQYRQDGRHPRR